MDTETESIMIAFSEKNILTPPPPSLSASHLLPLAICVCVLDVYTCCAPISESNFLSLGEDWLGRCAALTEMSFSFSWRVSLFDSEQKEWNFPFTVRLIRACEDG